MGKPGYPMRLRVLLTAALNPTEQLPRIVRNGVVLN